MSQLVNVNGVNRIMPAAPVGAYQTYQILAPVSTHFRPATCAEVDCPDYLNGWRVRLEALTPEVAQTARTTGRRYRELHVQEGETWLVFEAGQPCFRASTHRKSLEREPMWRVKGGDWRRSLGVIRWHATAEAWRDDFGEHQERIADKINEG